jgi:hypothetical protein
MCSQIQATNPKLLAAFEPFFVSKGTYCNSCHIFFIIAPEKNAAFVVLLVHHTPYPPASKTLFV